MAKVERPSDEEKISNFISALTRRFMTMPEAELDERLRAEGRDPDEVAQRANNVFRRAIKDYRLSELHAARARHERRVAEWRQAQESIRVPPPDECRAVVTAILTSAEGIESRQFIVQYDELKDFTDEDFASCYRQLVQLGAIDVESVEPEEESEEETE